MPRLPKVLLALALFSRLLFAESYLFKKLADNFTEPSKETRTKVAILDTGLIVTDAIRPFLCRDGHMSAISDDLRDKLGHGSNVASLIAKNLDPERECLLIVKWTDGQGGSAFAISLALTYLETQKISFLNLSLSGSDLLEQEKIGIQNLLKQGVHVVVAAGNEGADLGKDCFAFPACYPFKGGFHVVGALNSKGKRSYYSNYGGPVTDWAPGDEQDGGSGFVMSGTSQATANFTGLLVARLRR